MCRSKKDGKHGAGHKAARNKIRMVNFVREGRLNRRAWKEQAFDDLIAEQELLPEEQQALDDMYQDFLDYQNGQFDWEDSFYDHDYEYGYMDGHFDSNYGWEEDDRDLYAFAGHYPMDPDTRLFEAIDRAVRRHGVAAVHKQANILAAAFDVSAHEVIRCISLTREGYINNRL
jgi:hypothetical protein